MAKDERRLIDMGFPPFGALSSTLGGKEPMMTDTIEIDLSARISEAEAEKTEAERLLRDARRQLAAREIDGDVVRERKAALDRITDELEGPIELQRVEKEEAAAAAAEAHRRDEAAAYEACAGDLAEREALAAELIETIHKAAQLRAAYRAKSDAALGRARDHLKGAARVELHELLNPKGFNGDDELLANEIDVILTGLDGAKLGKIAGGRDFRGWVKHRNGRALELIDGLRSDGDA
jgi:hypothetical protein